MSTEKQVVANRQNAQFSTGPVTPEGKKHSSMNALKHGLRSERTVILGESPEEFDDFSRNMLSDLNPAGPLQTFLAEKAVEDMWRVQRAAFIEARLLSWSPDEVDMKEEWWDEADKADDEARKKRLCSEFWWHVWSNASDPIKSLHRYETAIFRRIMQCLRELRLMQKSRPTPAPSHSSPAETVLKTALSLPSTARHDAPHSPDTAASHSPAVSTPAPDAPPVVPNEPISPPKT